MSDAFVDTDVIIRLLTGDDVQKQAEAAALFERVAQGEVRLQAPVTVIADAVYVLASKRLYGLQHARVAELLTVLVRLPSFRVEGRSQVLRALQLYGATAVDFGDALLAACVEVADSSNLVTYDADFGRFPFVNALRPSDL